MLQLTNRNGWAWAIAILSALGPTVHVTGCGRSQPPGIASDPRGAPDAPSAYRATGAFVIRPFRSAVLVCTGTAIAPRVVLTAAHCVTNVSRERLEFTLGDDAIAGPTSAGVMAVRAYVHPDYDPSSTGTFHDIALVELEAPLSITEFERLLSANEATAVLQPGMSVELVGYSGKSRFGEKSATKAAITSLHADEMVIGGPGKPQSCGGDSGGPAFVVGEGGSRRIGGVVSRSANDATECVDGSIDTRVDAHSAWLGKTLATIERYDDSGR